MIKKRLVRQFARPSGPLGILAGRVMATRTTNVERNRWTAQILDPPSDARILELGHGPGVAIEHLSPRIGTGTIVGVEASELMSRTAARRNRDAVRAGRVELRVGDAQALPPDLVGFDIIYGVNVTMFWTDPKATISDLVDRLGPGGELVLVHMRPPTSEIDAREVADHLAEHFRAAGLTSVHHDTMDADPPAIATRGRLA